MSESLEIQLRQIFADTPPGEEWDLRHLLRAVKPPSKRAFLTALAALVYKGELEVIYRVVSPTTRAGIADIRGGEELPDTIFDPNAGQDIAVQHSQNVEVIYRAA